MIADFLSFLAKHLMVVELLGWMDGWFLHASA
jgi:hypothetical protein